MLGGGLDKLLDDAGDIGGPPGRIRLETVVENLLLIWRFIGRQK